MADVRVVLSGLWVAVMLTYLLGDVLRLMAGDMTPGEIEGRTASQGMWLGIAVIMLVPSFFFNAVTVWYAWRWVSAAA